MAPPPMSVVENRLRELVEEEGETPESAARQLLVEGTGTQYVWPVAERLYPDAFETTDRTA